MTNKMPPSLGDEVEQKFHIAREKYEVPGSRKEVVDLFARVLSGGGVQKVVLQHGRPMIVDRYVPAVDEVGPTEVTEDDLFASARNAEMQELPFNKKASALEHLLRAFAIISRKKLKPRVLLVNSTAELLEWLLLDEDFPHDEIFGVEVSVTKEIPDDVAVLSGSDPSSPDDIAFSVRISMNLPSREK